VNIASSPENKSRGALPRYVLDAAWPVVQLQHSPDAVVSAVKELRDCVARGCPQRHDSLRSTLDFKNPTSSPAELRAIECDTLRSFAVAAGTVGDAGALQHIELANDRWQTHVNTGTMYAARHYHKETRCVDWTRNPLKALYFACIQFPTQDAILWWVDRKSLEGATASQWMPNYGKSSFVCDDLERDFIAGVNRNILCMMSYPDWMSRAKCQEAFVTWSLDLRMPHDEAIARLGAMPRGRFLIPAIAKGDVLQGLSRLDISAETLGLE